jgi:hypothetical protein
MKRSLFPLALRGLLGSLFALTLAAAGAAQPSPAMSFFVTSVGNGAAGGDYGGLAGADGRCGLLADAVGAAAGPWRAYLSTGPWSNYDGVEVAADLEDLHDNGIDPLLILTEAGELVPSSEHDILTGSRPDGTAMDEFPFNPDAPAPTCFNWTSGVADTWAFVGHADWEDGDSWSSSHETQCHAAGLAATAGSGRLYCFALAGQTPIFADGFESGDVEAWSASPAGP